MYLKEGELGSDAQRWLPQTPAARERVTDLESKEGLSPLNLGERDIQLSQETVLCFPWDLRVLCNQGVQEVSWCFGDPRL